MTTQDAGFDATPAEAGTTRSYELSEASALLARTLAVLDAWLRGLPDCWLAAHEGAGTWTPKDVVRHLVHAERTNFLPRAKWILEHGDSKPFPAFERLPALPGEAPALGVLLDEFAQLRAASLRDLAALALPVSALGRPGVHPTLGPVTLRQLLATWVAHDQDHIMQIARVLARQYRDEVGPWRNSLRVISGRQG